MLVKDLITKLTKLVKVNPDNALLEVRWYDHFSHELCHATKELPVKIFEYIYTGGKYCILNAINDSPYYGYKEIKDELNTDTKNKPNL